MAADRPLFRLAKELYKDFGKPPVDEVMSALGRDADPEMVKKAVAQRAAQKPAEKPAAKIAPKPPAKVPAMAVKPQALPAPEVSLAVKPQALPAPQLEASLAVKPQGSLRKTIDLDYYGSPVQVMQNPTPARLQGFLNKTKYKAARRIVDPASGDVYVWDADAPALHALVAERLGLKYDSNMGDMIGLD